MPQPFVPTDIVGLDLWAKADALSLSDADPIGAWPDSSAAGHNGSSSGAARPTFRTAILNGLPVARLDGSNDYVSFGTIDLHGAITIATVIAPASLTGFHAIFDNYDSVGAIAQYSFGVDPSGSLSLTIQSVGAGNYKIWATASGVIAAGTAYRVIVTHDGTLSDGGAAIYVDGVSKALTPATSGTQVIPTSGFGATSVGRSGDISGNYFAGDIPEVLAYDSALGSTDLASVYDYLGRYFAAAIPGNASGAAPALALATTTGTATGVASAAGAAPATSLSAPAGTATGAASSTATAPTLSLSVAAGAANGGGATTPDLTSTFFAIGSWYLGGGYPYATVASGNAAGTAPILALSAPVGSAVGGTSIPGNASGAPARLAIAASAGSAAGGASIPGLASGISAQLSLAARAGTASAAANVSGTAPRLSLSANAATAVGQAGASGTAPRLSLSVPVGKVAFPFLLLEYTSLEVSAEDIDVSPGSNPFGEFTSGEIATDNNR